MFHVKHINIHRIVLYLFLFLIPVQTRILYWSDQAYIDGYFSYHRAIFLYFTDLVFLVCFVSWLFNKASLKSKPYFVYAVSFIFIGILGLFHVEHENLAWYSLIKWVEVLLVLMVAHETLGTIFSFTKASIVIFISALIQSFIAILQFHMQHGLGLSFLGEYIAPLGTAGLATIDTPIEKLIRAYGTFSHPNVLGAFLVFGLIMGLFYVSRETLYRTKRFVLSQLLVSCGTIIVIIAIFVTFSRIAWAGVGLSLIAFFLFHVKRKSYSTASLIVVIAIVSCATIFVSYSSLLKSRTAELNSQSNSIVLRESFNQQAQDIIASTPYFGVGIGNYIPTLQRHVSLEPWQYQPAHNIFLHIGVETGMVGLGLFWLFLVIIFRSTWNIKHTLYGFTGLTLGVIFNFMAQFDHYFVTIQQGRLMFFAALGIMLAAGNMKQDEIAN
jgi:O-antigen ligase